MSFWVSFDESLLNLVSLGGLLGSLSLEKNNKERRSAFDNIMSKLKFILKYELFLKIIEPKLIFLTDKSRKSQV